MYKKPMPTIRPTQEAGIRYAMEKMFQVNRITFPYRNCLNCQHWNIDKDLCGAFNSRPPTEVIVYGCEYHADDEELPF